MNTKLVFYILGGIGLISGIIMVATFNPLFDFILEKVGKYLINTQSFTFSTLFSDRINYHKTLLM